MYPFPEVFVRLSLLLLLFKSVVCLRYVFVTPATIDERDDDDWLLLAVDAAAAKKKKEEKSFLT